MQKVSFSKWHGLGNDFIIVNSSLYPDIDFQKYAKIWCDRRFGIGADGLVTVRKLAPGNADFEMRIFNSDGSETEMCGNATRCVAAFIRENSLGAGSTFCLHTKGGMVRPRLLINGSVRVDMGEPRLKRREIPVTGDADANALELEVEAAGHVFTGSAVSMGNPHLVIFVPDINDIELENWGSKLEYCPLFPNKTNVEFVQVLSRNKVRMRVWERGCGVTSACGTGSCATVAAGVLTYRTDRTVQVDLDGGSLEIEYNMQDNHIYMTGPAVKVYQGEIAVDPQMNTGKK